MLRPEWFRMKTTFRDWPLFSYTRPGRLYCNCAGYNLTPFFGVGTCSPILGHGHLVDNRPFSRCNLQSSIWKCLFPVSACDFFAETSVYRFRVFSTPSGNPAGGDSGLSGGGKREVGRNRPNPQTGLSVLLRTLQLNRVFWRMGLFRYTRPRAPRR